ncbi:ubiquitin and ribosomal protein S27a [Coprinopsis cinerea AmutBmut pab1-1]|nr:ubiquitin and ribosomal protein S27a [Coprinopsis cinerea AmutBmut pab1-1]
MVSNSNHFPCSLCGRSIKGKGALATHERSCRERQKLRRDKIRFRKAKSAAKHQPSDPGPSTAYVKPTMPWENIPRRREPIVSERFYTAFRADQLAPGPHVQGEHAEGSSGQNDDTANDHASGYIRTTYHPHSNKPPTIVTLDDYRAEGQNSQKRSPQSQRSTDNRPPWYPFRTRADFELSRLTLKAKMSKESVGELLTLFQRCINNEDLVTFDSYESMEASWNAASHLVTPFDKVTLSAPYKNEDREFPFYYRSLWDLAVDLIKDETLKNDWVWDARIQERFDGQEWKPFVTEPFTASDFFDIQDNLPPDGSPLGFALYADKTQLSSFGSEEGHPVYVNIVNLPSDIRNGAGIGGGRCVGWLPKIGDANEDGKTEFVDFKRVVWHECFKELLSTIAEYSRTGCWVECGDGAQRRIFPFVLILAADYEEQVVMAGIRGLQNEKPCPVCLVDRDRQTEYSDDWEIRSPEDSLALVKAAQQVKTKAGQRRVLEGTGLRVIENAFFTVANSNPYRALSFDRLHNYPSGLAKTHLLARILELLDGNGESQRDLRAKIEQRADSFPRWRGLIHFPHILTETSFQDANHWEDMARVLMFILPDIFPSRSEGKQLLRCLRIFLNLNAYSSFELHTDETINAISNELKDFSEAIKAHSKINPNKTWNVPKAHVHMHLPRDIRANVTTSGNEDLSLPTVVLEFWSSGVLDRSSGSGIKFKRPVAIADREDRAESDRSSEGKVLDNRLRNIYYRETVFIVELASYQEVWKRAKEGVKATSKEYR